MDEGKQRKVLAVDDNQTNLALLKIYLQQMGLEVFTSDNTEAGIEIAFNEKPDVILLDIMMPGIDGFEACKRLKADSRTSAIPIIFVSAKDQACDKIHGLELGAIDYIVKPFDPGELKSRIAVVLRMITLQEKLLSRANTDGLTGLANRRHFFKILDREILQAEIQHNSLALIMLDIDNFKDINDNYGHLGGDVVLKQISQIIQDNTYTLDVSARYGGEEFVILMPGTTPEKAVQAAEKLRSKIEKNNWNISAQCVTITLSFGVAAMDPSSPVSANDLIRKADTALYAAKRQGRNRVICWDDLASEERGNYQENKNVHKLQVKVSSLAKQLHSQALGTVTAFAKALAIKDPYAANHSEHVQTYVNAIAEQMDLPKDLKEQLSTSSLLHDLGKICVPDDIIAKTGRLTEQEFDIIKQHPVVSVQILSPFGFFNQELLFIKHHHENFDGTGYPDGLIGKKIPFGARIIAVAVAFDAITSDRHHSSARTCSEALEEIKACAGTQFDPDVVEAFLKACQKHKDQWPLSTTLQLATANS